MRNPAEGDADLLVFRLPSLRWSRNLPPERYNSLGSKPKTRLRKGIVDEAGLRTRESSSRLAIHVQIADVGVCRRVVQERLFGILTYACSGGADSVAG